MSATLKMLICGGLIILSVACQKTKDNPTTTVDDTLALKYTVLSVLPHYEKAFTEGLVIHNNKILESTGLNNQSWIAEVDIATGAHDKKVILAGHYFGEGITVLNNKVYQLTYREKSGFVYDASTYQKLKEFTYQTEGWGLTHDDHTLIMSDGTDKLYFLDTVNFSVVRTLAVKDAPGIKLKNLNELEFVDGHIFANVYETSQIVKIDVPTGKVVGRLDLSTITNEIKRMYPNTYELNGIAYDRNKNAFLVTGKNWPKSYLINIH